MMGNRFISLTGLFFLVCSAPTSLSSIELGGSTILDVSSRLSRELKARMQEHLDKIFGFGKSEVFVHVDVGFSEEVKKEFEKTLKSYLAGETTQSELKQKMQQAQAAAPPEPPSNYNWLFPGLSREAASSSNEAFILPGFTVQGYGGQGVGASGAQGPAGGTGFPMIVNRQPPATPFADPNFLYAIGLEIRRIFVKVALDQTLPADAEMKVQALVAALLELNPQRGDRFVVTRFRMPNPILELFKDSAFLSVVLKWATIAILILIGLMLATLFILLALRSFFGLLEHWVNAFLAMRHRTNEIKLDLPEWLKAALPAPTALDDDQAAGLERTASEAAALPKAGEAVVIRIPPQKAADLYYLIGKEDPGHVALVVARLPEDTKSAFLNKLPPDQMGKILAGLANPQYVEPEMMHRLKEELERRVAGVVGGQEETLRVLEAVALSVRLRMLKTLERQNAELYRSLRKRLLLFEDLLYFTEQELNLLLSKIPIQDLTTAIANGITPLNLKEKVLRSLPRRTAQTVQEMLAMTGKPPEDKILEAQDRILRIAQKMITDGGLRHPLSEVALP